jgi:hypothetical protein
MHPIMYLNRDKLPSNVRRWYSLMAIKEKDQMQNMSGLQDSLSFGIKFHAQFYTNIYTKLSRNTCSWFHSLCNDPIHSVEQLCTAFYTEEFSLYLLLNIIEAFLPPVFLPVAAIPLSHCRRHM